MSRGPRCSTVARDAVAAWALVAVFVLFGALPAAASSRYSLRGDGEMVHSDRADIRALGGASAASTARSLAGNPATLAFGESAAFFGSWETEWIRSEEFLPGESPYAKEYSGFVPNLGLVFPLPRHLALGLGLLVTRHSDGTIEQSATTPDGTAYDQSFESEGNEIRFPIMAAWNAGPVSVGSGVDFTLINSRFRWRNDFDDTLFRDSNDTDTISLWSFAWRVGARAPIGSRLAVGAWASFPSAASGTRTLENDDNDDSDDLKLDVDADRPVRVGGGVEARPVDRLRLVADWVHEGWSEVDPVRPGNEHLDVDRISVGAEWAMSGGDRPWPMRVGYRTEKLNLKDSLGEEVREQAFTIGTGFAFAGGRGQLDTFLEYVQRGEADVTEYTEQAVRFGFTLTGFESWSRPTPPEAEEDW